MPDMVWEQAGGLNRREQEVGPGEYAPQVYTVDAWKAAVAMGRAFLCTSARITTDLTNTHIIGHVANTSADHVVVIAMVVANQAPDAMVVGSTMANPTAGVPAPNVTPFSMRTLVGGQEAPQFTIGIDRATAAPTGGTVTSLKTTTFKGRNELELGLPIGPGQSIALYIPLGAVSAGDGTFAVYAFQEPV